MTTSTSCASRPSRRLRHVATTHPYDNPADAGLSLRGSTDIVAGELAQEVAERVTIAGVEIVEVRISHLAYASEIAQAMLRRQQANAVVAARTRIVDGAVGMVELALDRLSERGIVDLDEERKAAMVSNLWSCSAVTSRPRRSSTPAPSTRNPWVTVSRFCCGSTRRSTTPSPGGRTTSSAA